MTSTSDLTGQAFFDTLNGFDEIAITKQFGTDVSQLTTGKDRPGNPTMLLRALVFVDHRRRTGAKDAEAYKAAMNLTLTEVHDYFADDEPAEMDPDDPDTEAGKEPSPSD